MDLRAFVIALYLVICLVWALLVYPDISKESRPLVVLVCVWPLLGLLMVLAC